MEALIKKKVLFINLAGVFFVYEKEEGFFTNFNFLFNRLQMLLHTRK